MQWPVFRSKEEHKQAVNTLKEGSDKRVSEVI
jgi:hypothetical protein